MMKKPKSNPRVVETCPTAGQSVKWPDLVQWVRQIGIIGLLFVAWLVVFVVYMNAAGNGAPPPTVAVRAAPARAVQPTTSSPTQAVDPAAHGPAANTTVGGQAPAAQAPAGQASTISFARDVLPIFQQRCAQCHGARRQAGGVALSSYDEVMQAVVPGDPNGTDLVNLIQTGMMPRNSPPVAAAQVQTIVKWIQDGAKNN
jgi:mono/diheme cytochrome c family protein